MPKTRSPYPPQFRQQIVELARAGRTIAELSREFGCSEQTIRNWIGPPALPGQGRIEAKPTEGALNASEREELVRLRRELKRVQTERDILAKATAWFAARGEKMSTPSSN